MTSDALKKLDPTTFENLIFDLLMLKGLQNVRWRTPGADGGRDIEADEVHVDMANTQVIHKWYIECKKYKGSVDWPTIFSKIAYAESQSADYLLMCTSAKFTPTAISQMEQWNLRRGSVQIRLWPGHEIEHHIKPYFDLRAKYGITPAPTPQGDKLTRLSLAVSKSIQTYCGKLIFTDTPIDPMIIGAQSIALLIQQRIEDLNRFGSTQIALVDISTINEYQTLSSSQCLMDHYAYVALLDYFYALSGERLKVKILSDQLCQVLLSEQDLELFCRYKDTFSSILFWGDIEWTIKKKILSLHQRVK